ncbi:MAG: EAL domain-containing protein [bacterium]|nr:EAL domain-containing protein [bacterium]
MRVANDSMAYTPVDMQRLLQQRRVAPYYQPLFSISKRAICGFEALARGISDTGEIIPPAQLFLHASEHGCLHELNQLCMRRAVESFTPINEAQFLTINFETRLIDKPVEELDEFQQFIESHGVQPKQVVIEILESKTDNLPNLVRFVELARDRGFMIALDDFGAGYSNLDRITVIQPDILKLDRFLIHQIPDHYYKQEVVHSLINLAHKFGSLVVAEGVEEEDEAITCLELGADILQGFYLGRPMPVKECVQFNPVSLINPLASKYKEYMIHKTTDKITRYRSYDTIVSHIIYQFSDQKIDRFEDKLQEWVEQHPSFECIYILNDVGVQITETVSKRRPYRQPRSSLYNPAPKGTDHSNKPYFFFVFMGMRKYVTDPYVSLATGNLCITISVPFNSQGTQYLLCIDIVPDYS